MSQRAFRAFVVERLAAGWIEMVALSDALRHELAERGAEPSLTSVERCLRLVHRHRLLADLHPPANGRYRSGKVELDAARCLARVWAMRGDPARVPEAGELVALFRAELRRRRFVREPDRVRCGAGGARYEEVYPDLLALLTPQQRDRLLLAEVGADHRSR